MSLPDHSSKVENGKRILSLSLTTHSLDSLETEEQIFKRKQKKIFFIIIIFFFCSLLFVSPSWNRWTSGERKEPKTWSLALVWAHLSASCAHVYTWPQPSHRLGCSLTLPFTLPPSIPHPHPPLSPPKVFLPTVEEILQPRLKWTAACSGARCVILITHMQPSRPGPSYCKLWKLVRFKGD